MARNLAALRRSWIDGFPQRTRRVVAVASVLGVPLGFLLPKALAFVLLVTSVVGALALLAFLVSQRTMAPNLDERQLWLRARAWAICYTILNVLILAAVLVVDTIVLVTDRLPTLEGDTARLVLTRVPIFLLVLPLAVLAWLEPDAPGDA